MCREQDRRWCIFVSLVSLLFFDASEFVSDRHGELRAKLSRWKWFSANCHRSMIRCSVLCFMFLKHKQPGCGTCATFIMSWDVFVSLEQLATFTATDRTNTLLMKCHMLMSKLAQNWNNSIICSNYSDAQCVILLFMNSMRNVLDLSSGGGLTFSNTTFCHQLSISQSFLRTSI